MIDICISHALQPLATLRRLQELIHRPHGSRLQLHKKDGLEIIQANFRGAAQKAASALFLKRLAKSHGLQPRDKQALKKEADSLFASKTVRNFLAFQRQGKTGYNQTPPGRPTRPGIFRDDLPPEFRAIR